MAKQEVTIRKKRLPDLQGDKETIRLIHDIRHGLKSNIFISIKDKSPFSLEDWSSFLRMALPTMKKYIRDKKLLAHPMQRGYMRLWDYTVKE